MIENLKEILENHLHWLEEDCDNWEKLKADLSYADLRGADLRNVNLSYADLSGASLENANLCGAFLAYADLSNTNLNGANLDCAELSSTNLINANLSEAKGLVSSIDYLKQNFEFVEDGVIAYKTFNGSYVPNSSWKIEPNSIITENVNANRADLCGCGINVAPLKWVKETYTGDIWKVLIKWEWLCGVVVPYNTNGKIRCEKVQLIEIVDRS